ncbi:ABC transporter substrate-binding protein [Enterovirga aerilata]|uniref:ABC transporter substrate-binding protein n=1 Tax=Enterovirga aerilata TaxID=2730920 RepID=A0A849I521_9HYPH|nr:ABC transporter substrate-binding protein [Enterovirga sp. DB1703]NNM71435.1 ABC transporter substrate-binding protein [Enterovirga sp. DB1703]
MTTQVTRRAVSAGLGALFGAASARPALSQAPERVTYLTPFGFLIDYAETMYGTSGGFFAKQGLDLVNEGGKGSAFGIQQLTAGNVLISRTGGTDLLKAYVRDPQLIAIAGVYPKDLFWVISHRDKPIQGSADLAGKTVGVISVGGATENLLDMMLAKASIPKSSVSREAAGNAPSAFELVKAGRLSGYIATHLTVHRLRSAGQPIHAWCIDEVAPSPGDLYVTTKRTVEERPETLVRFLRGVDATLAAIGATADTPALIASMSKLYDIPETKSPDRGVASLDFARTNFAAVHRAKLAVAPATFVSARDLMVAAGIIPEPKDDGYFTDAIRKKAFG